jgi:hypothetical protein
MRRVSRERASRSRSGKETVTRRKLNREEMENVFDAPFDLELPSKTDWRDRIWLEIEEKHVIAKIIQMPTITKIQLYHFSGRTDEHRELCARAAQWLTRKGRHWTARQDHLGYAGGIADVATPDGSLFVECGYVRPEKILRGLLQADMLVVPYATDAVLFQRAGRMRFEKYLSDLQRMCNEAATRIFERDDVMPNPPSHDASNASRAT